MVSYQNSSNYSNRETSVVFNSEKGMERCIVIGDTDMCPHHIQHKGGR